MYRALRGREQPKSDQRRDYGTPRNLSRQEMESYCEVIAAIKIRTNNKKGRHLSTQRAIELLEEHGMDTPSGFIQPPKGLLTKATVNRYLKAWGYAFDYITRQPAEIKSMFRGQLDLSVRTKRTTRTYVVSWITFIESGCGLIRM